jgi:hypothetical protein
MLCASCISNSSLSRPPVVVAALVDLPLAPPSPRLLLSSLLFGSNAEFHDTHRRRLLLLHPGCGSLFSIVCNSVDGATLVALLTLLESQLLKRRRNCCCGNNRPGGDGGEWGGRRSGDSNEVAESLLSTLGRGGDDGMLLNFSGRGDLSCSAIGRERNVPCPGESMVVNDEEQSGGILRFFKLTDEGAKKLPGGRA